MSVRCSIMLVGALQKNKPACIGYNDRKTSCIWTFAIFALLTLTGCRNDPESPGAKTENSVVQAIAVRHKQDEITKTQFISDMGHSFVCIPSDGRRIWIMLDAKYTPYYKQSPWDKNFSISRSDFERIEKHGSVTDTVIQCLASHITDTP